MEKNVLDEKRKRLLPQLAFTKRWGWYLAGGTALALQAGHRTSVDFDFYTQKKFKPNEIIKKFKKYFAKNLIVLHQSESTLSLRINEVPLTCFYYDYHLITPLIKVMGVNVASQKDIAAMKIIAITQRGNKRDFIDIYYLAKKFTFNEMFRWTLEKYPNFNIYLGLRALMYFEDAEEEELNQREIKIFDKNLTWSNVKKGLEKEVKEYQSKFLK